MLAHIANCPMKQWNSLILHELCKADQGMTYVWWMGSSNASISQPCKLLTDNRERERDVQFSYNQAALESFSFFPDTIV